jgi:hypothetical protein
MVLNLNSRLEAVEAAFEGVGAETKAAETSEAVP